MADAGVDMGQNLNVSLWRDQSGNQHDASQSTISRQPRCYNGLFNGKPGIRFDGSDDVLVVPSVVLGANDFTLIAVAANESSIAFYPASTSGIQGRSGQNYLLGSDNPGGSDAGSCLFTPAASPLPAPSSCAMRAKRPPFTCAGIPWPPALPRPSPMFTLRPKSAFRITVRLAVMWLKS